MKLPKRFALSTAMLLMLAVAVVFGYAQSRRQYLLQETRDLRRQGANVGIADSWFWPTVSRRLVRVNCTSYSPTAYSPPVFNCDGASVSVAEAQLFYVDLLRRLEKLGVNSVDVTFCWYCYTGQKFQSKEFQDVTELTRPFLNEYGRK